MPHKPTPQKPQKADEQVKARGLNPTYNHSATLNQHVIRAAFVYGDGASSTGNGPSPSGI